jgi:hypothetical protein
MWKTVAMKHHMGMMVMMVASLSLLGSLAGVTRARADTPTALCTLQIATDGNVLGTLRMQSSPYPLTLSVPAARDISVPVPCKSRQTAVLTVINQANHAVTVNIETFTEQGQLSCTKAPHPLPVHSGSVVTFADCP